MEHESCDYCYEQLRPVAFMRAVGFTEHDGRTAPLVKVWCGLCETGDDIDPEASRALRSASTGADR